MATLEQERVERAALQEVLTRISRVSGPELARSEAGAEINFEAGLVYFNRILRLFSDLEGTALEDIPYSKLIALMRMATRALDLLQEARDFKAGEMPVDAEEQRDSILERARDEYEGMFEVVAPILAFSVRQRVDSKVNLALFEARQTLTQVRNLAQEGAFSEDASANYVHEPWVQPILWFAFVTVLIGIGLILKLFEIV
jgi:hypothetical protein